MRRVGLPEMLLPQNLLEVPRPSPTSNVTISAWLCSNRSLTANGHIGTLLTVLVPPAPAVEMSASDRLWFGS